MVNQTKQLLRDMNGRFNPPKLTPIATEMYLPNHSGTHDAGILNKTPTKDNDLVNKKYVDDEISGMPDCLKLDQTTPQTIINGQPRFNLGLKAGTSTINLELTKTNNLTGANYPVLIPTDDASTVNTDKVGIKGGIFGLPMAANGFGYCGVMEDDTFTRGMLFGIQPSSIGESLLLRTEGTWTDPYFWCDIPINTDKHLVIGSGSILRTDLTSGIVPSTGNLRFSGEAAKSIIMGKMTGAKGAGNTLTIKAGDCAGTTNTAGGDLILSSGFSYGTSTAKAGLWAPVPTTSGTKNDPVLIAYADGNGFFSNKKIDAGSNAIQTTGDLKGVHKSADGTSAVADGTYTMGLGGTTNGTITIKDGIITAVQQCVA
jgi:hypothetical protein